MEPPEKAKAISVYEFCRKWMPVLYKKKLYQPSCGLKYPGDIGFVQQAAVFLAELLPETGSVSSYKNYLSGRQEDTPTQKMLEVLLGQLDYMWSSTNRINLISPLSDSLEMFCKKWSKIWWLKPSYSKSDMARFISWILAMSPKDCLNLIDSYNFRNATRIRLLLFYLAALEESWHLYLYHLHLSTNTFRKRA
ncbi:hypothetical protein NG799_01525 [Laspinema sp. D1]|uniref:Uncharacterized protein n=2 Tax=Laspinema TaxID=2584823 RepID=A0ABT2MM94_9CYAN|nr:MULTISPECIES: hypothetical protein [unclassified Laspinema]MCT7965011.1 hypothetical protein [Laspinema sp. D2a]MCT7977704.1 hypothetical protein [Laspinema sp. D3b]MCT7992550.1 hypothetical protein [Laspinema sp. D3c]